MKLLDWLTNQNCVAPTFVTSGDGKRYVNCASPIASVNGANIIGTLAKPFQFEELEALLQQVMDVSKGRNL